VGHGGSGCRVAPAYRGGIRYRFFLRAYGLTEGEVRREGDGAVLRRLGELLAASREVDGAVCLALDATFGPDGKPDWGATPLCVPDEFVAGARRVHPRLHFGASVHPHRPDARERLHLARESGALLVKWLPPVQRIDPADRRHVPFYETLAALDLPLLTHTGVEYSLPGGRHHLGDPERLALPLEVGVTVIAAHAAQSGRTGGEANHLRLHRLAARFPRLYADLSSLTQLNRLGGIPRALADPALRGRLLYGTDMPVANTPLVWPWAFAPRIGLAEAREAAREANPWDRDVRLKRALGVPDDAFTLPARLLLPREHSAPSARKMRAVRQKS
jgi:hypothetical protein